jgi:hypothetical protein
MGGARFLHRAPTHVLFLAKESTTQDAEYKSLDSQTRLEKSELEYFGIVGQSDGFELEEIAVTDASRRGCLRGNH